MAVGKKLGRGSICKRTRHCATPRDRDASRLATRVRPVVIDVVLLCFGLGDAAKLSSIRAPGTVLRVLS